MENNNNNEDSALISEKKSTEKDSLIPILMKKGDYTVHILIEEVKNLISANEFQNMNIEINNPINTANQEPKKQKNVVEKIHLTNIFILRKQI